MLMLYGGFTKQIFSFQTTTFENTQTRRFSEKSTEIRFPKVFS